MREAMNEAIKEYRALTGHDCSGTHCADCNNAIWRIMHQSTDAEKYDAEPVGGKYSLVGKCTSLGSAITEHVYFCSDHTDSAEQQKAKFAGL